MGIYVSYVRKEIRYTTCPRCENIIADSDLLGNGQLETIEDGEAITCRECQLTFDITNWY